MNPNLENKFVDVTINGRIAIGTEHTIRTSLIQIAPAHFMDKNGCVFKKERRESQCTNGLPHDKKGYVYIHKSHIQEFPEEYRTQALDALENLKYHLEN